jgi:hypothetical protein
MLETLKNLIVTKIMFTNVINSQRTVRQCISVPFLNSSCERVCTQWCRTQDYSGSSDRLSLTKSNTRLA